MACNHKIGSKLDKLFRWVFDPCNFTYLIQSRRMRKYSHQYMHSIEDRVFKYKHSIENFSDKTKYKHSIENQKHLNTPRKLNLKDVLDIQLHF